MQTSTKLSFAAIMAMGLTRMVAGNAVINSAGTATSCGQNTCCIPSCHLTWSDGNGCTNGIADITGACNEAFSAADSTVDTGVDICDGAGAFWCTTNGGARVIYVVNRDDAVSAALWPAQYDECTLSGQCAPCDEQASCADAVSIGTSSDHSCSAFAALLDGSGVTLTGC